VSWKVRPPSDPFSDGERKPDSDLWAMIGTLGVGWVVFLAALAVAAVLVAVAVWAPALAVK
jgi:hypothetical protein